MSTTIFTGDCRDVMHGMSDGTVQCCISSPPYFNLRDYEVEGQIGLETVPDCLGWATGNRCGTCFVCVLVDVYREVWRVLKPDGTCWVNLGDSYAGSGRGGNTSQITGAGKDASKVPRDRRDVSSHQRQNSLKVKGRREPRGWKQKDLMGMLWRVALALQADGWYLRQDIIWHKPNPMPESATDRCTKSHEYLFLLAKSPCYYFDAEAIAEPLADASVARLSQARLKDQRGSDRIPGKTNGPMKAVGGASGTRNRRSVWTIPTKPYREAHFATYPPALIEPCVLASTRPGELILDPFAGSGTTGEVANALGRNCVLIELNPKYVAFCVQRTKQLGMELSHA